MKLLNPKIKNKQGWFMTMLLVVATIVFVVPMASAAVIQGYLSDDGELKPAMAVSLSQTSTVEKPKVERASQDNGSIVIGVTASPDDNLVTIASGAQEVFVQTSGEADVYVTDLNGDIRQGDLLTVSPLRGVLMKIDNDQATVVAIALDDFSSVETESRQIESADGTKEVKLAKIKVNLDHKAASNQASNTEADSSLRKFGRQVFGRDVGEIRMIIAMLIFLLVLAVEGNILYGSISSSITAMGRNPMAKNAIHSELLRVILVAIFVLLFGIATIYAILWI